MSESDLGREAFLFLYMKYSQRHADFEGIAGSSRTL